MYRERPKCRKTIYRLIEKGDYTLEGIASGRAGYMQFSDSLKKQARLMLLENSGEHKIARLCKTNIEV